MSVRGMCNDELEIECVYVQPAAALINSAVTRAVYASDPVNQPATASWWAVI
jgi:hypothetical protein